MIRSSFSIAASAALVLMSAHAAAHVRLVTPTPRHPTPDREDDTIKTAPCGVANDERTTDESRITVYEPGETITIEFNETIDHPGFYRVSFDDDGQDAFEAPLSRSDVMATPALPVLLDDIEDHGPGGYSVEVTLPNVECETCTLQVIQVMTSAMSWNAAEIYYTCADIALRASGAGSGGMGGMSGAAGGGTGGAGMGGMSGSSAGTPPMGGGGSGGMTAGSGGVSAGTSGGGNAATGGISSGGGAGSAGAASGGSAGATGGSAGTAGTLGAGGMAGTSTAGSAGTATSGASGTGAMDAPATEEAGCGCRTAPSSSGTRPLSLVAAALAALALRRRRG